MKILFVAAYFESDNTDNYTMPFIDRQMESLQRKGLKIIPFSLNIHKTKSNYIRKIPLIKKTLAREKISLIHAQLPLFCNTLHYKKENSYCCQLNGNGCSW